MLDDKFIDAAMNIYTLAPNNIWSQICRLLCEADDTESLSEVIDKLPETNNSDLFYMIRSLLQGSAGIFSYRELGLCLSIAGSVYSHQRRKSKAEIVWSGPSTGVFPVRRTDQVIYDLINEANDKIILVTFAAAKIKRLQEVILKALDRGVKIDLILEFEEESEGQLSFDALSAFNDKIIKRARIYLWPIDKRERNDSGRPGKLHAKCAVIDDNALITSANLTDDAFNRNMELGILFRGGDVPAQISEHFKTLQSEGILKKAE